MLDGGLSDIRVIVLTEFAGGGVDNQLNLSVFNGIYDIGPSFEYLEDGLGFDTIFD